MLVSNFEYLYSTDFPSTIIGICQKAEAEYIYEDYRFCAQLCRQAAEFMTKWIFENEDSFNKPVWYSGFTEFSDMLKSRDFAKWLGDTFIIKDVDTYIRVAGNESVHDISAQITNEAAHRSLECLFRYMTRICNRLYEPPHSIPYFEPYFDYDEEAPLERDYDSLIEEETDPEERAKLALLKKCEDSTFQLMPFVEGLGEKSEIKILITVLTDLKALRRTLSESPIQLRKMITVCYQEYDYREMNAVIAYAIKACRSLVRNTYKYIQKYLDMSVPD